MLAFAKKTKVAPKPYEILPLSAHLAQIHVDLFTPLTGILKFSWFGARQERPSFHVLLSGVPPGKSEHCRWPRLLLTSAHLLSHCPTACPDGPGRPMVVLLNVQCSPMRASKEPRKRPSPTVASSARDGTCITWSLKLQYVQHFVPCLRGVK